jgi:hypothetical protein
MKIIGIMLTWNNFIFFKHSLKQALSFCDEVWVVDGCHSTKYPRRSTDGTYEYLRGEYLKGFGHPKLKFVDELWPLDRYDYVQRFLRSTLPRESELWKPGNWVFQLDDDLFFFEKDLAKIRKAMKDCKSPALEFNMRYFIYNFRLNFFQKSLDLCYKISNDFDEKFVMKGVGYPRMRDGSKYQTDFRSEIIVHHYSYVKTPERMAPRWVMSVEKGTSSSVGRFAAWMDVDLNAEFAQLEKDLSRIRDGGGLNIYKGKHPEILDGHPWIDIEDVRQLK